MSDSCERPEFYAETFPIARKAHACCECDAPINVGEKHLKATGKSDGEFWEARQHMLCRELCMLMGETDGECFCFGEMREMWTEGDFHLRGHRKDGPYAKARVLYAAVLRRERSETGATYSAEALK
jgi:hypothetical protein